MTAPATVPEVLARAADIIEERGWRQGWFVDPDTGCVCAVGAMHVAVGLPPDASIYTSENSPEWQLADAAWETFGRWLASKTGKPSESAGGWNDHPSRTQAEVVAALRAAAKQVTP